MENDISSMNARPITLNEAIVIVSGLVRDRGEVMNLLSRGDVVMMLNDAGAKIESNSHIRYPSPDSFVEFRLDNNKGHFIVAEQMLYLWSGLGEHYDYAAEIKVKSADHFADILRALA